MKIACALAFLFIAACGGDKPTPTTPSTTADAASSATPEMGGREGAADGGGLGPIH